MRENRTVRKPTRWTADEWRRIEEAARTRRIPALRFVREAALAGASAPDTPAPARRRRRDSDELVKQLGRVLNNLRQLHGVAFDEGEHEMARAVADAIGLTEQAILFSPTRAQDAAAVLDDLVPAGRLLNETTHLAHGAEELPSLAEVLRALDAVNAAVHLALS